MRILRNQLVYCAINLKFVRNGPKFGFSCGIGLKCGFEAELHVLRTMFSLISKLLLILLRIISHKFFLKLFCLYIQNLYHTYFYPFDFSQNLINFTVLIIKNAD